MAISYPLSLPSSFGIGNIILKAKNAVAVTKSPFTFKEQTQQYEGQAWAATVTLPPMKRQDAAAWTAFLMALKGPRGTFLMGDPNCKDPQGNANDLIAKADSLVYSLFIPSGSDKLVDANGDTFKVNAGVDELLLETGDLLLLETGDSLLLEPGFPGSVGGSNLSGGEITLTGAQPSVTDFLKAGDYIQIGDDDANPTLHMVLNDADSNASGEITLDIWPEIRGTRAGPVNVYVRNTKGLFRLSSPIQQYEINNISSYGITFDCEEVIQ